MELLKKAANWQFLNEPFWRWLVFVIALSIALGVWHRVLQSLK